MKNTIRKYQSFIMACCLLSGLFIILPFKSYGASARITFSDPTVTVGNAVSVAMTVESTDGSPLGSVDVMLSYDASLLEFTGGDNANGGAGSIKVVGFTSSSSSTSMSFTLNFNAVAAGTAVVQVTNQEVYSFNEELMTMDRIGSSAVGIQAPATYSSEALLASLAVSPGALSPAFSPETTAYSMNVAGDVERVVVSANASHSGARVSVSGNTGLTTGSNTITCRVTAEDNQTTKTYTITVTKAEGGPTEAEETEASSEEIPVTDTTINIQGATYYLGELTEEISLPEGFHLDTYEYESQTISALKGIENPLILFYLINEAGDGSFYVYTEETGEFYHYQTIDTNQKTYILIPITGEGLYIPDGFERDYVTIKSQAIEGWVLANEPSREFCLFYAMNQNGDKNLYVYDFTEETVQRYLEWETEPEPEENQDLIDLQIDYNKLTDEYNDLLNITIALGVTAAILLIVSVNIFVFKGRKKDTPEGYEEDGILEMASTKESTVTMKETKQTVANQQGTKETKAAEAISTASTPAEALEQSEPEQPEISDTKDLPEETGPVDIDQLADLLRGFDINDLEKEQIRQETKKAPEQPAEEDLEDDDFEFFDLDD